MAPSLAKLLQPEWFIPLFLAAWLGLCKILAHLSGWPQLATRFRQANQSHVAGERFSFVSGCVGVSVLLPVSYHRCLFFTVNKTGFLMSIFVPFQFGSPPLFIPWSEVRSVTEGHCWFFPCQIIRIRGFSAKIMIWGRVGQSITQAYAQACE
jgi:hypothetical protein